MSSCGCCDAGPDAEQVDDEEWNRALSVAQRRLELRRAGRRKRRGASPTELDKNHEFSRTRWLKARRPDPAEVQFPESPAKNEHQPLWQAFKRSPAGERKYAMHHLGEEVGDKKFPRRPESLANGPSRSSNVLRYATGSVAKPVPTEAPPQHQQRPPDTGHPHHHHHHRHDPAKAQHRRHRRLTPTERARVQYEHTKHALQRIPEPKFFFQDAGAPHDTNGDLTTKLRAREQRDEMPMDGTAHGNFMNEGRLTIKDEQLTLNSRPRRGSCWAPPDITQQPPSVTSTESDDEQSDEQSSVASSKHLHDDGTFKNPLTKILKKQEQLGHIAPAPERQTLKEM